MQEYLRLCKKITGSRGFLLSNRTLCPHNHTVKKVVLSTPAAPARADARVVIAVVRAAPTEILPHERTQSRCIAQLHVLEQAAEAPCHTHDAQPFELGASPVRRKACG